MQFTRILFASSAFYRLGTVFGCITRSMQHTTFYILPPHLLPQGTSLKPCLVAVPCLLYRFRHPCGVLDVCLSLLPKLALFLVCSVLRYKDTTNFDTPKFLSDYFHQITNFLQIY